MSYLISQMWLCLVIAALLGAIFTYWLTKHSYHKKFDQLEKDLQQKLDQAQIPQRTEPTPTPKTISDAPTETSKIDIQQSSYDVEEVEGIGQNYGKKLRDLGISTTEQLLDKCCDLDGQIDVANAIGIEDFVIRKWACMSDLMRVNGIEGQYSELMTYAGIDTVQDLAQQQVSSLHKTLADSNAEQQRVKEIPDENMLTQMIDQAKTLPAKIQDL